MPTRGARFLREQGIAFELHRYEHAKKGAAYASQAIGFSLERTVKTLVVELSGNEDILVLMPGNADLDLKKLAKELSVKRASMADQHTAERVTGYLIGGISPFGTKKTMRVVVEEGLLGHDKVAVNAGARGVMAVLSPHDIVQSVNAVPLAVGTQ